MKNIFKNPIIKGTFILTFAGIISRILGFFYRIFLTRKIGADGIGLLQLAIPVIGISFALCSAGISTAISHFCASENDKNKGLSLTAGLCISLPLSILFSYITYTNSQFICQRILMNTNCLRLIQLLSFTFPFSAFHNCINGYYFGKQKTGLPALSQLAEQIIRITSVYFICNYYSLNNVEINVSVAIYGNLLAEVSSSLICLISLFFEKTKFFAFQSLINYTIKVLKFSVPLTATKLLMHILQGGESILIPAQLTLSGLSSSDSLCIYGILMGMALPFILFPSAITNSLAVMLLPEISRNNSGQNKLQIVYTLNKSFRLCSFMGIMCTFIFLLYGGKLGSIFFNQPETEYFIKTLSWLCPFYFLTSTLGSILNGLEKTSVTCIHNIISILIRISSLIFFVPKFGISAYMTGILIAQITICCAHYLSLNKMFHMGLNAMQNIIFPAFCCFLSAAFSLLIVNFINAFNCFSLTFILILGCVLCILFLFLILKILSITKIYRKI